MFSENETTDCLPEDKWFKYYQNVYFKQKNNFAEIVSELMRQQLYLFKGLWGKKQLNEFILVFTVISKVI